MKALQYIYTSWKNGDLPDKGYMIYSRSSGISDEECDCIKEVMQYMPPKGLKMNPTPEEIADEFPYSFAYFILPSGRACVANTTYLGKDYSGRYGNYIIHALIFEFNELTAYPVELFGEPYIKTYMTDEELNAIPPVPPLPALDIDTYGEFINDDAIYEFISDREEDCTYLISAILEGIRFKKPVYINDTRENLVLWMAALQKMLPLKIAKKLSFSTYVGNHEQIRSNSKLNLLCIGVRPDANYFDYRQEKESGRHIVLDLLNKVRTDNINVCSYALKMSEYMANSSDQLNSFKSFLDNSGYSEFDHNINTAHLFFEIIECNGNISGETLIDIITFGKNYCQSEYNSIAAEKILQYIQKSLPTIAIQDLKVIFSYLFSNASHMLSMIYSALFDIIYGLVETMTLDETTKINEFFISCKEDFGIFINGYIDYFASEEAVNAASLYLKGNRNQVVIYYYLTFILENYDLSVQNSTNRLIFGLFNNLLDELSKMDNSMDSILAVMDLLVNNPKLCVQIMYNYRKTLTIVSDLDIFYSKMTKQLQSFDSNQYKGIEKLLVQNPEYSIVAAELFSKIIEQSKSSEKDFEYYRKVISKEKSSIELLPLINAYIKTLNADKRFAAVVKLFEEMDESQINSTDILSMMVDIVEEKSISDIAKVSINNLKYIDSLCKKNNITNDKINAVIFGESLTKPEIGVLAKNDLTKKLNDNSINLINLSKSDYKSYVEKYFEPVLCLIDDDMTFGAALDRFNHKMYSDIMFSICIDHLKRLEKRKEQDWETTVAIMCRYTILNISTALAKSFESHLVSYLHKIKAELLEPLEEQIESEKLSSYSSIFFNKVREKKGFFSGLFKKG